MRRLPRLSIAGLLVVGGLWLAGPAAAQPPAGTQPAPPPTTALTPPAAAVPAVTAAAAPAPSPPVGPGLFDLAGRIREAINGWFRDLVASALDPTLDLVGRSVLATLDLTAPGGRVRELWGTSAALANTCYVLLLVVGGLLLMAHESLQTRYTVKDVAPPAGGGNGRQQLESTGGRPRDPADQRPVGRPARPGRPTRARQRHPQGGAGPAAGRPRPAAGAGRARGGGARVGAGGLLRGAGGAAGAAGGRRAAGVGLPRAAADRGAGAVVVAGAGGMPGRAGRPVAGADHRVAGLLPGRPRDRSRARPGPPDRPAGRGVPFVAAGPHPHLGGPDGVRRPTQHPGRRGQVLRRLPAAAPEPADGSRMSSGVRIPADIDRPDRILAGLSARQLTILVTTGAAAWARATTAAVV